MARKRFSPGTGCSDPAADAPARIPGRSLFLCILSLTSVAPVYAAPGPSESFWLSIVGQTFTFHFQLGISGGPRRSHVLSHPAILHDLRTALHAVSRGAGLQTAHGDFTVGGAEDGGVFFPLPSSVNGEARPEAASDTDAPTAGRQADVSASCSPAPTASANNEPGAHKGWRRLEVSSDRLTRRRRLQGGQQPELLVTLKYCSPNASLVEGVHDAVQGTDVRSLLRPWLDTWVGVFPQLSQPSSLTLYALGSVQVDDSPTASPQPTITASGVIRGDGTSDDNPRQHQRTPTGGDLPSEAVVGLTCAGALAGVVLLVAFAYSAAAKRRDSADNAASPRFGHLDGALPLPTVVRSSRPQPPGAPVPSVRPGVLAGAGNGTDEPKNPECGTVHAATGNTVHRHMHVVDNGAVSGIQAHGGQSGYSQDGKFSAVAPVPLAAPRRPLRRWRASSTDVGMGDDQLQRSDVRRSGSGKDVDGDHDQDIDDIMKGREASGDPAIAADSYEQPEGSQIDRYPERRGHCVIVTAHGEQVLRPSAPPIE